MATEGRSILGQFSPKETASIIPTLIGPDLASLVNNLRVCNSVRFFGFELREDISDIPALQPELRDASAYYTSLVNGGIITAAEARERLGFEPIEGTEEIRVPANIAGSATNPDEGGRPVEESEE